jgi:nucleotide-binding universal stress UspA family protein
MRPIKTILCPTDQSACSQSAFTVASALASNFGARLVILEVVPPPVIIYGPPPEAYLDQMRQELDRMQVADPRVCVERRLVEGNPVTEILRVAKETDCDLIVIGSHGRTGCSRLLMGSVAEQVLRRASCPVLVIKASPDQSGLRENDALVAAGTSLDTSKP